MYIGKTSEATDELHQALQRLIPQLGVHNTPPTWDELTALVQSDPSMLLIARLPDESGGIVGTLSLTLYRVPTGQRAIVEDLVVDERARRQGVGEALIRFAIELARNAGANGVALTSNYSREAANRFYQAIGFERRGTNAYFYRLK